MPARATVPTGSVVLTFRNQSSLEHNLTFTGGLEVETRTIVQPGDQEQLVISDLAPGSYEFVCTIHDVIAGAMSGVLIVEPAPGGAGAAAIVSP